MHERVQCLLQDYRADRPFDLITMRMVAEHIEDPVAAGRALRALCKPGGRVVIYTVWKWSPASVSAAVTPMWVHHGVKRFLFGTEERDTFPVAYKMNTRRTLTRLMAVGGFAEESFRFLDDCRTTNRWQLANRLELSLRTAMRTAKLRYPESNMLAIYRREG